MERHPSSRTPRALELAVAAHVVVLLVGVSWAFGGNADWVRTPIAAWASAGIALSIVAMAVPAVRNSAHPGTFRWAWPIIGLNVLVGASLMTTGFKTFTTESGAYSVPLAVAWWTPSAANPSVSAGALWLFDGIYFSCLNLALLVSRRRTLRFLATVLVVNTALLAVFGTAQKLAGSKGIYFGSVPSPQVMFFASFVYDNHWGAYCVLSLAVCAGLAIRYVGQSSGRGFFDGPSLSYAVAAFLVGLSVPLSGSRACSLLVLALGAAVLLKGSRRVAGSLRGSGLSRGFLAAAAFMLIVAAGLATWWVAGEVIGARAAKTKEQVSAMWSQGGVGSRTTLYHDTWRMARQRPLFGWGMGSFPSVFRLYNTQESRIDRIPVVYHDAHSDWLQSLAEIGFVGTLLIGGAAAYPAASLLKSPTPPFSYFPWVGCALVALYAWVEFPFGNVAVVLAWWFCAFSAAQYARLTLRRGERVP